MVGIRSFPFGFRPIFRGELLVSGRVTEKNFKKKHHTHTNLFLEGKHYSSHCVTAFFCLPRKTKTSRWAPPMHLVALGSKAPLQNPIAPAIPLSFGKWWGPLGMVTIIINPIYTLYSEYCVYQAPWVGFPQGVNQ